MGLKVNLGSGEFPKPGYVNVDFYSLADPDIKHDLNVFPWPFATDAIDELEADHVLEHLEDPFAIMTEIHRVVRHGGRVSIRVPHFSRGFTHPDHKRGFNVSLPLFFDPGFQGGYAGVPFELKQLRLHWFAQPYLKKVSLPGTMYWFGVGLGSVCDFFANFSPYFCSRVWCYLVGGFDEIHFELIVRKDEAAKVGTGLVGNVR
ncbi:MAG TPA: methyltransferase domain-containing protein [Candidatus Limnocylindria bacterium]|nr:methyltransferase domain-containing protein [Candidatus Limnocylindria bacterium]